jgi:diguanylate cyclase
LIARISGDEFVVLIKGSHNELEVIAIAESLKEMVEQPASLEGQVVAVTVSVGVSFFPDDGESGEVLLRHADSAMYQVKTTGKNRVKRYQATVDAELEERKLIQRDLYSALPSGELQLRYQPIFDLTTGELKKVEALLCWHHPTRGLVSPEVFIELAETSGLILPIGTWVLHEACSQARAWHLKGLTGVTMSVNISPLQFLQTSFSKTVFGALEASGLEAHYLELELTETIVIHNVEAAKRSLRELQMRGVAVAMDDFGTGYSSLSYLKDLMIDTIKIDKSFIHDLSSPRRTPQYALAVITAIVTVAQTLDIAIVAEGIEREEQFTLLRDMGVGLGQGFFFSSPLPADALEPMFVKAIKETAEPVELPRLN